MKKSICWFLSALFILSLTACSGNQAVSSEEETGSGAGSSVSAGGAVSLPEEEPDVQGGDPAGSEEDTAPEQTGPAASSSGTAQEESRPAQEPAPSGGSQTAPQVSTPSAQEENQPEEEPAPPVQQEEPQAEDEEGDTMETQTFYVTVGGSVFAATFADNVGAQALRELLAAGPVTISMSDYGSFEKVGPLGQSLPTSNSQTTTQAGDIVLYQGNQIVIFYGSNSWSYTRLGKINDLTGWAEALGSGSVSVTFSLTA